MRLLRSILILFLLGLAVPAAAQEADILTGKVTGTDGKPVIGARVEVVSAETEITPQQEQQLISQGQQTLNNSQTKWISYQSAKV